VDFWDLTKLIFRRWPIALPLLVVTIVATGFTAAVSKPDYVMTAYVQLVPPSVTPDSTGAVADNAGNITQRNPWYALGLGTLGQASIYATQDQKFLDELYAGGHSINFSLTMGYPDPTVITVQVVATTRQETITTTQLVIKWFQAKAQSLQKQRGVHDQDLITTQRLDQGENLKVSGGNVKRAIIAVAVVGLLLTIGVTILYDAIVRRRARRREQLEKANPLAVEIALARNTSAGNAPNGKELPELPVARTEPPAASRTELIPRIRTDDPGVSPLTTAVIDVGRREVASKPNRMLLAGTYRSINAAAEPDSVSDDGAPEDAAGAPKVDTDGPVAPAPADVRIVLQPEWMAGENGGKRR
jgi:hypothetical protein